jgi:hypothetical protein
VALIGKADGCGYFCQWYGSGDQAFGPHDPYLSQVAVRRQTNRVSKDAQEVKGAQVDECGEVVK